MSDYSTLLADINGWLLRADLGNIAPTLVQMAEDRHVNDIRVRAQTRRSIALGLGTRYLPLPNGFVAMRRLRLVGDPPVYLRQESVEGLQAVPGLTPVSRYCIHEELEFNGNIGTEGEVEMVFWRRFTRLSDANPSNWLVANAYGCYLYAALVEAAPYIVDDPRVPLWEQRYQIHKTAVLSEDRNSHAGGAIMATPLRR